MSNRTFSPALVIMKKFVLVALCLYAASAVPVSKPIRKANSSIGGRIIGGEIARSAQFPSAAAIYISTTSGTFFCAGALITNQWILTAGHCLESAVLFTIRLGSNSLTSNDGNTLRLATETYVPHPDYDSDTLSNDIGLIKLRASITFTDYIRPVDSVVSTTLPDSSSVVTYGWGQVSDSVAGLVDQLHYVYLTTLSNEDCRLAFGTQVTSNVVCVDGNYNEGTCRGDSGSPLVQVGGTNHVYLVGISSFISQNGCESTDPSGYTRTSAYYNWINNSTATF